VIWNSCVCELLGRYMCELLLVMYFVDNDFIILE
jgi:hypothetical protein